VLSPLNKPADKEGSKWEKGRVTTPKGFKEAYRQFVEAGWNALQAPAEYADRGCRRSSRRPCREVKSANLSFSLVHDAHRGRGRSIDLRGTEEQKKQYL